MFNNNNYTPPPYSPPLPVFPFPCYLDVSQLHPPPPEPEEDRLRLLQCDRQNIISLEIKNERRGGGSQVLRHVKRKLFGK
jgi:hypothetical protein